MGAPTDRRYSKSHEWHKLAGNTVTLGITRFAVDELTDVTFVELPKAGTPVTAGKPIGEIESVKATGEVYTGVSGKVVEVNQAVIDDPAAINNDPYESGWLVRIEMSDPAQFQALLDAAAYDKLIG